MLLSLDCTFQYYASSLRVNFRLKSNGHRKKMAMHAVGRTQLRSMASPRNIALLDGNQSPGCKNEIITRL
jgi:hypothetical protein